MNNDNKLMMERFINNRKQGIDAIVESYKRGDVTKDQLIEEGLWDRVKARGAGLKGATKGLGNRVAGAAKGAVAGVKGDVAGVQAAQVQQQAGQAQGLDAKSLSIVNSHLKNLNKVLDNFENDLTKLGMDPETIKTSNPEAAAALTSIKTALSQVTNAFKPGSARASAHHNLKTNVQGSYKANTTSSERAMMKKLGLSPGTAAPTAPAAAATARPRTNPPPIPPARGLGR